jgi:hypothetical protein
MKPPKGFTTGLRSLYFAARKGLRTGSGGVAEWSKAAVLKTAERKLRGFESLLLRKAMTIK